MTYLLRSFSDDIRPYTENVSKSIVNLLVTCPDSIATRKVGSRFQWAMNLACVEPRSARVSFSFQS